MFSGEVRKEEGTSRAKAQYTASVLEDVRSSGWREVIIKDFVFSSRSRNLILEYW